MVYPELEGLALLPAFKYLHPVRVARLRPYTPNPKKARPRKRFWRVPELHLATLFGLEQHH